MLKNVLIKFLRIFWLFCGCGGIFSLRNSRIPRINLEFLASVALLPRNDAGNSRIPYRAPPKKRGGAGG